VYACLAAGGTVPAACTLRSPGRRSGSRLVALQCGSSKSKRTCCMHAPCSGARPSLDLPTLSACGVGTCITGSACREKLGKIYFKLNPKKLMKV
jgi:hypothetical protein